MKNKLKFVCAQCGSEFERWECQTYKFRTNQKFSNLFCSKKCKGQWQVENFKGKINPNWKGGLIEGKCLVCGKKFFRKPYNLQKKFCSFFCYGSFKSKSMKGRRPFFNSAIQRQNLQKYGWGIDSNKNCVRFGTDDLKHMLAKTIVSWILSSRGRNFYTELPVKNGIIDIVDLDEKIAYEVENHYCPSKIEEKKKLLEGSPLKDIIIFDIRKYSSTDEDLQRMFDDFNQKIT